MIAEKPKAAKRIAEALGDGHIVKCTYMGIPYYIINDVVVLPSAGHLFGLSTDERGYPVFSYRWVPIHQAERGVGFLAKYYKLMAAMLPRASLYVNACDYDIEGSVIGFMIIKMLGNASKAYRMKYSALTRQDIRRAWANLEPLDVEMVEAGLARHEVDWIWGINISRALMDFARRASGKRIILSAGRVQSPTLVYAYRTWLERALHVPKPVFQVTVELEKNGFRFSAKPLAKIETRADADRIVRATRKARYVIVEHVESKSRRVRPPPAFNLPTLQAEAARIYGFSPSYTQRLAEELYLAATISYPRTNSEKLPPTIGYRRILEEIAARHPAYSGIAMDLLEMPKLSPRQGKREDPAHPAIYPTGTPPPKDAGRDALRVYDLIVRRFLAAFHSDAMLESTLARFRHPTMNIHYIGSGTSILDDGWLAAYPYSRPDNQELPKLKPRDNVTVVSVSQRLKWTNPQSPKITRMSLVKWMEKVGIGTEATRARIVETLYKRGYLEKGRGGDRITLMGMTVSSMIEEMFPQLSTPDLTRKLERELEEVRMNGKSRRIVVEEAKNLVARLINEFRQKLESGELEELAERAGLIEPRHKCELCGLPAVTGDPISLCEYHREALMKVSRQLQVLMSKTGLDLDRLLAKIAQNGGEFVSDIAKLLVKKVELRRRVFDSGFLSSEDA